MMVGWGANRISVKLQRMGLAVTEFLPKESLSQGQFNEYAKFAWFLVKIVIPPQFGAATS